MSLSSKYFHEVPYTFYRYLNINFLNNNNNNKELEEKLAWREKD